MPIPLHHLQHQKAITIVAVKVFETTTHNLHSIDSVHCMVFYRAAVCVRKTIAAKQRLFDDWQKLQFIAGA